MKYMHMISRERDHSEGRGKLREGIKKPQACLLLPSEGSFRDGWRHQNGNDSFVSSSCSKSPV